VLEFGERLLTQHNLQQWQEFALNQDGVCFRVLKLVADFTLLISRVHGTHHYTHRGRRDKGDRVLRPVERQQANAIPFAQSQTMQPIRDTVHHRDHFPVSQVEIMIDDRRTIRIAHSRHTQQVIVGNIGKINRGTK